MPSFEECRMYFRNVLAFVPGFRPSEAEHRSAMCLIQIWSIHGKQLDWCGEASHGVTLMMCETSAASTVYASWVIKVKYQRPSHTARHRGEARSLQDGEQLGQTGGFKEHQAKKKRLISRLSLFVFTRSQSLEADCRT